MEPNELNFSLLSEEEKNIIVNNAIETIRDLKMTIRAISKVESRGPDVQTELDILEKILWRFDPPKPFQITQLEWDQLMHVVDHQAKTITRLEVQIAELQGAISDVRSDTKQHMTRMYAQIDDIETIRSAHRVREEPDDGTSTTIPTLSQSVSSLPERSPRRTISTSGRHDQSARPASRMPARGVETQRLMEDLREIDNRIEALTEEASMLQSDIDTQEMDPAERGRLQEELEKKRRTIQKLHTGNRRTALVNKIRRAGGNVQ
jgi:predicted  nucleic acid-binding Zn-ribbon protein